MFHATGPALVTERGAMDMHAYLRTLLVDVATAPAVETGVRYELLAAVLAPLGPAGAVSAAHEIEEHAYWVRYANHATGADTAMADSVDRAAYLAAAAFATQVP